MRLPIYRLLNRSTWIKVHLYLALISGFFFALMGLTGSISVYREERFAEGGQSSQGAV